MTNPQLKIGDKVSFDHYGETKTGTIAKLGKSLVFLTDGRWLHRESVQTDEATHAKQRLEYLRGELRAEQISYGELAELQSLFAYIDSSDVELLEAAVVPENAAANPQAFAAYMAQH